MLDLSNSNTYQLGALARVPVKTKENGFSLSHSARQSACPAHVHAPPFLPCPMLVRGARPARPAVNEVKPLRTEGLVEAGVLPTGQE